MSFRIADQLLLPWSPKYTISTERVAEILDVSHDTVSKMCQDGTLKAYKIRPDSPRSPWRISYDSLMQYIEKLHEQNGLEKRF